MLQAMHRHPVVTAVVVWLLAANSIRTAFRLEDGSGHRWWMDLVVVLFGIYGVGLAWYAAARGIPGLTDEHKLGFLILALGLTPFPVCVAGVFLGSSAWAGWFTALAMAVGLAAWVHHARHR